MQNAGLDEAQDGIKIIVRKMISVLLGSSCLGSFV